MAGRIDEQMITEDNDQILQIIWVARAEDKGTPYFLPNHSEHKRTNKVPR